MNNFNPANWYWQADDGRLYSSARFVIVKETDKEYKAWRALGLLPSLWPKDDVGEQTEQSIKAVLASLGVVAITVTPKQLRLWLLSKGMLSKVEAAIAALPDAQRKAAEIEWEYALSFEHNNPLFGQIASAMGLTSEQIDEGFREAAQL